jgi:ribosomal protein S18 acetylase RimI-like enzyme
MRVATIAGRATSAWFDAMLRLCKVTPSGWVADRGGALALATRSAVPTLNAAVGKVAEPEGAALAALERAATDMSLLRVPWSVIVPGNASESVVLLAARDVLLRAEEDRMSRIGRVTAAQSAAYTDALTAGFAVPRDAFGSLMDGAVLDMPELTGYMAYQGGEAVATGLGICIADLVGVFNIAVVPWARCKGFGKAMTAKVVAEGLAAGADAAYLHATPDGRPLYESMGFRVVATWTAFTAP